jgi:RHS repeat-associated protein
VYAWGQLVASAATGLATPYGWDLADRLTSYTKGTTSWSYAYDGDGLRSSKSPSGGAAVAFTYDVAEGLPLIASDGSAYYITRPGGLPLEQTDLSGNPTAYYHHDQIGSTRALTSPTGAVSTFSWSPWGQSAASSGSLTTPFGWAGQYADSESGLVWLRARYYSPSTGQFLSRDPHALERGVECDLDPGLSDTHRGFSRVCQRSPNELVKVRMRSTSVRSHQG